MRVKVRLFARLREAGGFSERDMEVPPDATVADVWQSLATSCPALAPYRDSTTAAINADFAKRTDRVGEGDEIAFLPPVSGGHERVKGRRGTT
jgi:molybdopterin converting factor subunit 1